MFIAGDELILLRQLPQVDIASCEGVVGWVSKGLVRFTVTAADPLALGADAAAIDTVPRTVLIAPSPPTATQTLPELPETGLDAPKDTQAKRISSPFELETPSLTPTADTADKKFFTDSEASQSDTKRESVDSVASSAAFSGIGGFMMGDGRDTDSEADDDVKEELRGESAKSTLRSLAHHR